MAHLVLFVTFVAWSLTFLAAQFLQRELSTTEALAARFVPVFFAAVGLLALRRSVRFSRGAWRRLALMGLVGVPGYNLFFFVGLRRVPSGTAALLVALSPVFTAILARIVYGERLTRRQLAGLALALAGVFIVVRFGTDKVVDWSYVGGALLFTLAPLSWAFFTTIGRGLGPAVDPFDANLVCLAIGSAPMLFLATRHSVEVLAAQPGTLACALFLGLVCTMAGYAAWIWALKRLPAAEVAAFAFLNPPLANFWAWLLLGTPLRLPFVVGALMLLVGVGLIVFRKTPAPGLA